MSDPTYDKRRIFANPEWRLAWVLSEIENDAAPIGWSKYCFTAGCLLASFDMTPKGRFAEKVEAELSSEPSQ